MPDKHHTAHTALRDRPSTHHTPSAPHAAPPHLPRPAHPAPADNAPPENAAPVAATGPQGSFAALLPALQRAVAEEGYALPTPIQEQVIPHLLVGRDLLG